MSLFLLRLRREKIWNYVLAMFTRDRPNLPCGRRFTSIVDP